MTVIENRKIGGNSHQKVPKVKKWCQLPFFEFFQCQLVSKKFKPEYFKIDSFFKLQNVIMNNFYNSYEQPEIYFRKKGHNCKKQKTDNVMVCYLLQESIFKKMSVNLWKF
jgi:hypothetical protein